MKFKFVCSPEVISGKGSFETLGEVAINLGGKNAFVVIDQVLSKTPLREKTEKILENHGIKCVIFDKISSEPTTDTGNEACALARKHNCDITIGIGGGSSLDTAKAVAGLIKNPGTIEDYQGIDKLKFPSVPKIMVPTTAGTGSEVTFTAVFIRASEKKKAGINSKYLYPEAAILDPLLTLSLPPSVTSSTGMDAFCHAIESYLSKKATFFSKPVSMEAMKLIWKNLPVAFSDGNNVEAREHMLYASFLAGVGLANAGVTAVHSLSYPLGGLFGVPHGVGNAVLLPFVLESTLPYIKNSIEEIAQSLTGEKMDATCFIKQLKNLEKSLGIPESLKNLDIPEDSIPVLIEGAMQVKVPLENHPVTLTEKDIEHIYQSAF
ncbi:MAG TPA: iron-containing alcohol dehydrogenase [bacterium]|nr:iron-containing alcohol dehydrogenase [bacterium]HOL34877.1 iron-containing alcohol dehydrogenase [bacterium]HPP09079.1 iron-containing alcohol dehydrogenase [bacterium]